MRIGSLELRREDFPDLSTGERTDRLLRQLNRFGTEAGGALDHGLTFADNFAAEVRTVEIAAKDEWVALSLQNGWAIFGTSPAPAYRASRGRVELRGVAKAGTLNSPLATLAATAPATYQLQASTGATAAAPTTPVHVQVGVALNGEIATSYAPAGLDWVSLDGIGWDLAAPAAGPAFPVRFKSSIAPSLVFVGAAWDVTDKSETPVSLGSVAWSRAAKGGEIVVSDIGGVYANRKYRVKLVIVAG